VNKSERDKNKKVAMDLAESGNLEEALRMFKEIQEWDVLNENAEGEMDVLGYIRTVYTLMADHEKDSKKKKILYYKALEVAQRAITISQKHPDIAQDPMVVQEVYLASALLDSIREEKDPSVRKQRLSELLGLVTHAMAKIPGPLVQKTWPATLKAKIEYEMGSIEDSLHTLIQAQEWVIKSYKGADEHNPETETKLNVWLSGLMLATADICSKEEKPFLAKHYATYVLNMHDPTNALVWRKKEAQKVLDSIK
jgi:tetratricopeptide (TPR) repeat protein